MATDTIVVRTHIGRDLLQSAALFKTAKLVLWEYVSNGLQYKEPGISSVVNVTLDSRRKQIVVDDNGRGMDRDGLQNFFVMHGENVDRKAGRPGRGRFGTGKAAAFGIADDLRVSSIRDGMRNTVELSRKGIEAAGGDEIPVQTIERNVNTNEPNGTIVTLSNIRIKILDQRGVISFIERHLAHWPQKPLVVVNNHPCEFTEPPISRTLGFRPSGPQRDI
jgi:HSP90 family molecular chaperone